MLAHSEVVIKHLTGSFCTTCVHFRLTISIGQNQRVMFTLVPGQTYFESNIFVNGIRLEVNNIFVYLENTLSRDGDLDAEICYRIGKGSAAFGNLER